MLYEWAIVRWATQKGNGETKPSRFNVRLNPNDRYIISLDQSTSCTGISIFKVGTGITMAIELERTGVSPNEYKSNLLAFMRNLIKGNRVVTTLIEDVFEGSSPKTYQILETLASDMEKLLKATSFGRVERILNPVWVAEFLNDVQVKGKHKRATAKMLTQQIAIQKYPWALGFKEDAYDAIGILDSYVTACFNGDTTLLTPRLMNTFVQSKGNHKYDFEIISSKQVQIPELQDILLTSPEIITVRYNTILTPDDNAKFATELYKHPIVSEPISKSNWTALFCMLTETYPTDDNEFRMIALNTAKTIKRNNFFEPLQDFVFMG